MVGKGREASQVSQANSDFSSRTAPSLHPTHRRIAPQRAGIVRRPDNGSACRLGANLMKMGREGSHGGCGRRKRKS